MMVAACDCASDRIVGDREAEFELGSLAGGAGELEIAAAFFCEAFGECEAKAQAWG